MARRKSSITTPSESQAAFVEAVMEGHNQTQAAVMAGYPAQNATNVMRSKAVQAEIAKAREEVSNLTTLKRLDVIEGIMDGISTAKMMADAGNIIRGWTEIAKILGHYAPEVKTVNLNVNQQRARGKLESLTDEELLAIINAQTVDGEVIANGEG